MSSDGDSTDVRLSVTEAAQRAGINRRTIQRWLRGPDPKLTKAKDGTVSFADVVRQREGRKVGRRPKGLLNGERGEYWRIAGTPDWERARVYFGEKGLDRFRRMVVTLAHRWVTDDKGHIFIDALRCSLSFADAITKNKTEGELWSVHTRKFLAKLPLSEELQ